MRKFNLKIIISLFFLGITGCANMYESESNKEIKRIAHECSIKWENDSFNLIRKFVPWDIATEAYPEMNSTRIPTLSERALVARMLDIFSPCKLQSAQIIYQSVPKEGAKTFLIRADNEIKILQELKAGKISYQEANRKRKAVVAWQYSVIQQDEIRLKKIESQNRNNFINSFSEELKKISEKAKEEANQLKSTTTECSSDGRGGIRCNSRNF
jgi:hypothetical protein